MASKEGKILGIDPGSNIMGFGVIEVKGGKTHLIEMGVFKMKNTYSHFERLKMIFDKTNEIILLYRPDEFAIEAPFYGNNIQSMLKLGRAQGAAISAALYNNLVINEYSPRKVKQAITGNGNSSKEQIAGMLKSLLNFNRTEIEFDATDGLAVAYCHSLQYKTNVISDKYTGWDAFLKKNPSKVIGKPK